MNYYIDAGPLPAGRIIKDIRERKGLTMEQFADIAGVSVSTISRWESGERTPTIETFMSLLRMTGADLQVIVR